MKAAALLQAYARGVRKRMQDKEEAERKPLARRSRSSSWAAGESAAWTWC